MHYTENLAVYQVANKFVPSSFRYRFVWDPIWINQKIFWEYWKISRPPSSCKVPNPPYAILFFHIHVSYRGLELRSTKSSKGQMGNFVMWSRCNLGHPNVGRPMRIFLHWEEGSSYFNVIPNPNQQVLTQPLRIGLWFSAFAVSNTLNKGVCYQYKKLHKNLIPKPRNHLNPHTNIGVGSGGSGGGLGPPNIIGVGGAEYVPPQ